MVWSLVLIHFIVLNLGYDKNKLYKTLEYLCRDMSIFDFLEKGLEIASHQILCMIFQEKYFSCYILLTDKISLSDCLYFLTHWSVCVMQLSVNQAVTS